MAGLSRRSFGLGAALLAGWQGAAPARAADKVFRVASQKGAGILLVLKQRRTLEQRLRPLGWSVSWTEFPAGPQLLESLNVGVTDFGLVGEGPPIFAQAAGAAIVYVGAEVPSPRTEAIVVPKHSPIRTIAALKGKQVALNKGSDVNYLLIRALEANGLSYGDIRPAYLAPADARAAFEQGSIDAWVIWDPYYADAQIGVGARTLADGTGLAGNVGYYMATRQMADRNPQVVKAALAAINEIDLWAKHNPKRYAAELAASLGIPAKVSELWVERSDFGTTLVDAAVLAGQQRIADAFAKIGLIPRPINVHDAVWTAGT